MQSYKEKSMKKIIAKILFFTLLPISANAVTLCQVDIQYTSCNPGYYLWNNGYGYYTCVRCGLGYYGGGGTASSCSSCSSLISNTGLPIVGATTASDTAVSATECYIPGGSGSDTGGSFSWPTCYAS